MMTTIASAGAHERHGTLTDRNGTPAEANMKEMISTLYEYGIWVSHRLLARAANLSPAQLTERFTKGTEPILPTFGHLVSADIRWLARWQLQTPPAVSPADFPTLDVVRKRWDELWTARRAYIDGLDD